MNTTFDIVAQIQLKKVHFWIALVNTFRIIYNLFYFRVGPHFSIVSSVLVMTSFLVKWFSNLHILWNFEWTISLPNFNAVGCLCQVLQTNTEKRNADVIVT